MQTASAAPAPPEGRLPTRLLYNNNTHKKVGHVYSKTDLLTYIPTHPTHDALTVRSPGSTLRDHIWSSPPPSSCGSLMRQSKVGRALVRARRTDPSLSTSFARMSTLCCVKKTHTARNHAGGGQFRWDQFVRPAEALRRMLEQLELGCVSLVLVLLCFRVGLWVSVHICPRAGGMVLVVWRKRNDGF